MKNKYKDIQELADAVYAADRGEYSEFSDIKFKFKNTINLYNFTDVHIGHRSWDKKKFEKAFNEMLKDPNGYCWFNGDQLDFTPGGHHNSINEQSLTNDQQVTYFLMLLKKAGKKCLAIRHGNHELRQALSSANPLFDNYCALLRVPLLHIGPDRFHIFIKNKRYEITSSHGMGFAKSRAMLDRLQLISPTSDIYFSGHTHEFEERYNYYKKVYNEKLDKNIDIPVLEIAGGNFQKWDGHARDRGMRPTNTGCYILTFTEDSVSCRRFS